MKSGNKSTSEEAKKQQEAWAKKAKPAETAPEHAETSVAAGTDPRDAGTPIDFSKVEIEPLFKEYVDVYCQ